MDRSFDVRDVSKNEPERALPHTQPEIVVPLSRERQTLESRGYRYQVSPSEMATLHDIGRFRTIDVRDLLQYRYRGGKQELREDFQSLAAQGLIRERTVWTSAGDPLNVVVLTKTGRELLAENARSDARQAFYAGFVKAREIGHDAAIFRMYQAEAKQIARSGGRVRRIILDYELKQKVYRPLARIRPHISKTDYAKRQAEVAAQNGLKVTGGKILLPDLRIEYETSQGGTASVDLELATHHYRGSALRGKAEAGFKLYAPADSVGRLSAYDPELMADIVSF